MSVAKNNIDYLLSEEILDEIEEEEDIPEHVVEELNEKYMKKRNDVAYIFYTGKLCSSDNKHSINQFIKIASKLNFHGTWPYLVAIMGAGVVWKETHKIPLLIDKIFRFLEEKEKETEGPYTYYTRQEFDANNATYFEEMSNAFLIGIKTKLDEKMANVLITCFESVIENNFWRFEDIEESVSISEDETGIEFTEDELQRILDYDVEMWIELLKNNSVQKVMSNEIPPEQRGNLLRRITYGELIHPELKKFDQKYFAISELHSNLEMRMTIK